MPYLLWLTSCCDGRSHAEKWLSLAISAIEFMRPRVDSHIRQAKSDRHRGASSALTLRSVLGKTLQNQGL